MLDKVKNIYSSIPKENFKFLKLIPNRLLFGSSYGKFKNKVSFDKKRIAKNLFKILEYSREYTLHGNEHIPKDFSINEVFDVLKSLPIITSKDLSNNIKYFQSKEFNKYNSYYTTTGGSGRNPTTILLSNESFGTEWAHMHHIWNVSGYNKRLHPKLTLRGNVLKKEKLFEFNPIYNEYVANTYKMNQDNFDIYIDLINKKGIKYIHGYPSLVKEFCNYMINGKYKVKLDGIFLGSEGISVEDKSMLKITYDGEVVSWYGQTEKVILAQDFTGNNKFKVFTSYGYPSIHNADKENFGEILGTTFINKALPLIKYSTGDFGSLIEKENALFLENIKGRWGKDFIYLTSDKKISTTAINLHSLIQKEILFYQIHQKEYGKLKIKILPKKSTNLSSEEITDSFKSDLKGKLDDFKVEYKIVERSSEILRSIRGKMIMLIQEIN
jgi:phenylacetate-CoA ligase